MAAVDLGGSGDHGDSQRSTAEELLSADPQALRRKEGACGSGAQAGRDLLETIDRLARPSCSSLVDMEACAPVRRERPVNRPSELLLRCGSDSVPRRLEQHNVRRLSRVGRHEWVTTKCAA